MVFDKVSHDADDAHIHHFTLVWLAAFKAAHPAGNPPTMPTATHIYYSPTHTDPVRMSQARSPTTEFTHAHAERPAGLSY